MFILQNNNYFFYRNARTYASRTSWHLSVVRFVRTLTYVDQVELWYFKLQDLSVFLHHLCFYLCTKWPMANQKSELNNQQNTNLFGNTNLLSYLLSNHLIAKYTKNTISTFPKCDKRDQTHHQ